MVLYRYAYLMNKNNSLCLLNINIDLDNAFYIIQWIDEIVNQNILTFVE